ncbi:DnaA N-terminal domain-containing protein [Bacillus salinus]|uniref:DnaA N-terminal domain-containing protein n=1 Tax=Bacillus sp. HMF5848 TaxID=2495421 RepID=UPI00163AD36A|nr:DnaA N-terminal domain-containing protein [Bacillus sp. HMF5848]
MRDEREIDQEALKKIWADTLDVIERRISKPAFQTWFKDDLEVQIKNDVLCIRCIDNPFRADWLDNRYKTLIFESFRDVSGQACDVEIYSNEDKVYSFANTSQQDERDSTKHQQVAKEIQTLKNIVSDYQEKLEHLQEVVNLQAEEILNLKERVSKVET